MSEEELREEMALAAKRVMGIGFAPAVYRQMTEDFVQIALQFRAGESGPVTETEKEWPTARKWLGGELRLRDGYPYEL